MVNLKIFTSCIVISTKILLMFANLTKKAIWNTALVAYQPALLATHKAEAVSLIQC